MNLHKAGSHSLQVGGCVKSRHEHQKALYEQYSPSLFALCIFYTGNTIEAEELLEEVFVTIFKNLHTYNKEESLDEWIEKNFADATMYYLLYKRLVVL